MTTTSQATTTPLTTDSGRAYRFLAAADVRAGDDVLVQVDDALWAIVLLAATAGHPADADGYLVATVTRAAPCFVPDQVLHMEVAGYPFTLGMPARTPVMVLPAGGEQDQAHAADPTRRPSTREQIEQAIRGPLTEERTGGSTAVLTATVVNGWTLVLTDGAHGTDLDSAEAQEHGSALVYGPGDWTDEDQPEPWGQADRRTEDDWWGTVHAALRHAAANAGGRMVAAQRAREAATPQEPAAGNVVRAGAELLIIADTQCSGTGYVILPGTVDLDGEHVDLDEAMKRAWARTLNEQDDDGKVWTSADVEPDEKFYGFSAEVAQAVVLTPQQAYDRFTG